MSIKEKLLEIIVSIVEPIADFFYENRRFIGGVVKAILIGISFVITTIIGFGISTGGIKFIQFLSPHISKKTWWIVYSFLGLLIIAMVIYIIRQLWKSRKAPDDVPENPRESKGKKNKDKPVKKPRNVLKWILLTLVLMTLVGIIPFIFSLFIQHREKKERREEIWIKTTVVMSGSTKPAFDSSISTCQVWDTPTRFEMVCTNQNGKDIFLLEKGRPPGRWWRKNREKDVFGTFVINKDPYRKFAYTGITTTGTGSQSIIDVSLK